MTLLFWTPLTSVAPLIVRSFCCSPAPNHNLYAGLQLFLGAEAANSVVLCRLCYHEVCFLGDIFYTYT